MLFKKKRIRIPEPPGSNFPEMDAMKPNKPVDLFDWKFKKGGTMPKDVDTFEDTTGVGRGASVVDARNLDSLVETLAGYNFHSYAENQVPMFIKRTVIQGQ